MAHYTLAIIIGKTNKTLSPKNADKAPLNSFLKVHHSTGAPIKQTPVNHTRSARLASSAR
jgi:hypothetical protein